MYLEQLIVDCIFFGFDPHLSTTPITSVTKDEIRCRGTNAILVGNIGVSRVSGVLNVTVSLPPTPSTSYTKTTQTNPTLTFHGLTLATRCFWERRIKTSDLQVLSPQPPSKRRLPREEYNIYGRRETQKYTRRKTHTDIGTVKEKNIPVVSMT